MRRTCCARSTGSLAVPQSGFRATTRFCALIWALRLVWGAGNPPDYDDWRPSGTVLIKVCQRPVSGRCGNARAIVQYERYIAAGTGSLVPRLCMDFCFFGPENGPNFKH